MSTTEQPVPRPIIPALLAEFLQRAMSWRFGAGVAAAKRATAQDALEADTGEPQRGELPWWVIHNPAVSFRDPHREETRDQTACSRHPTDSVRWVRAVDVLRPSRRPSSRSVSRPSPPPASPTGATV